MGENDETATPVEGKCIGNVFYNFGKALNQPSIANNHSKCTNHKIDYFISHSWSVWWLDKLLSLLVFFNLENDVGWSIFVGVSAGMLLHIVYFIFGIDVLTYTTFLEHYGIELTSNNICSYVSSFTFFMVILLSPWICHDKVFLDRLCIEQCLDHPYINESEETLKTCELCRKRYSAVYNLAECVHNSKYMIAVYSTEFFDRLWCVYEFACHIASCKPGTLIISHIYGIWQVILTTVLMYLWAPIIYHILTRNEEVAEDEYFDNLLNSLFMAYSITTVAMFIQFGSYRFQLLQLYDAANKLESFCIKKTLCSVDTDRTVLHHNIARLMQWVFHHASITESGFSKVDAVELHYKDDYGSILRDCLGIDDLCLLKSDMESSPVLALVCEI